MSKQRIKVTTPLFFDIEVDDEADDICGYDCPQWEEQTQKGKNEMKAVCRVFGRLRWMDSELSYRHKQCMAAEVVKRRKK
jgi:CxxC motif-containing protein